MSQSQQISLQMSIAIIHTEFQPRTASLLCQPSQPLAVWSLTLATITGRSTCGSCKSCTNTMYTDGCINFSHCMRTWHFWYSTTCYYIHSHAYITFSTCNRIEKGQLSLWVLDEFHFLQVTGTHVTHKVVPERWSFPVRYSLPTGASSSRSESPPSTLWSCCCEPAPSFGLKDMDTWTNINTPLARVKSNK